ncbi:MAG TPA: pilus assembly protein TadG-related protein, partial [Stellaceae bacterium]|nr:pilus assembly protein TadG-related protein [Stellaceae bacterium]
MQIIRRFARDQQGVVAIIVAIAATALVGFTALGVETGLWYTIKRQNQSAADAAALAGAYERAAGQNDGESSLYGDICAKAQTAAAANGFTFSSFTCPSSSPACTNPSSGHMCANNPPVGSTDDK